MKDTVFIRGVKSERESEKFGIEELRKKDSRCSYDQTDVGMSFVVRLFQKKFYVQLGDVLLKMNRG